MVWLNPTESQYTIQWDTMMVVSGTDGKYCLVTKGCGFRALIRNQEIICQSLSRSFITTRAKGVLQRVAMVTNVFALDFDQST